MQNTDGLTPMDRELEAALGGLQVTRATISRDRVMFSAGRASIRRRNHLWQGICSVLALSLLVSVVFRPTPGVPERRSETVAQQQASGRPVGLPAASIESVDSEQMQAFRQYIRTRRAVLDRGVEAIPASYGIRGSSAPPLTREDIDELLSST